MRALFVVLLMACVCTCYANPSHILVAEQKDPHVTRKIVRVGEAAPVVTPKGAKIIQRKSQVKEQSSKPSVVQTPSVVTKQTVIVKEASPRLKHKTIVVKKKVKKRKVCRRFFQNGPYRCDEISAPKKVEVKRVHVLSPVPDLDIYDQEVFDAVYGDVGLRYQPSTVVQIEERPLPIGLNLHINI